jgi:hypothetical protein
VGHNVLGMCLFKKSSKNLSKEKRSSKDQFEKIWYKYRLGFYLIGEKVMKNCNVILD